MVLFGLVQRTPEQPLKTLRTLHLEMWSRNRVCKVAAAFVLLVLLAIFVREHFSFEWLVSHEARIQSAIGTHRVAALLLAFLIYAAACLLPVASGKSLICGWLFGFATGVLLVSCASTFAAAVVFSLSRYWLRDTLSSRYAATISMFTEAVRLEGGYYLFSLRLIPVVPYTLLNAVMGLTSMKLRTFWWVSQLGMLPGNCVCVYAGASVPNLRQIADQGASEILTPQLLLAFVCLAVFPWIARQVVARLRQTRASSPSSAKHP